MTVKASCLSFFALYMLLFSALSNGGDEAGIVIKYPGKSFLKSKEILAFERDFYAALEGYGTSEQPVNVLENEKEMSPRREWSELLLGEHLNVLISPLQPEQRLGGAKVIPYPVMRGLLGFRQSISHESVTDRISNVDTKAELLKVTVGQPDGWFDLDVYQANGVSTLAGPGIESTIRMLNHKRFDIFPIGVIEAGSIFRNFAAPYSGLVLNERPLIYYHLPMAIHLNPSDEKLHAFLKQTLEKMLQDGTLDEILDKHFSSAIRQVELARGEIVELKNPKAEGLLTEESMKFLFPTH